MEVKFPHSERPFIGDEIQVVPVEYLNTDQSRNWYRCRTHPQFPSEWRFVVSVPKANEPTLGEEIEGWIYKIQSSEQKVVVTTDDFGKQDLHSLKERHIDAADHIVKLVLKPAVSASDVDLERVSWAKGMLSRCLRKDQWDWYTVFELLGRPPERKLGEGRRALARLRDGADAGDDETVREELRRLGYTGMIPRFTYFIRRVNCGDEYTAISADRLLKKLHELEPTQFENFLAECWSQRGWETTVTKPGNDFGVDVIARREQITPRKHVIQAKRYDPDKKISLGEMQRYASIREQEDADEGYLITTGKFTSPAKEQAENLRINLVDGPQLVELIRDRELHHVVDKYVS